MVKRAAIGALISALGLAAAAFYARTALVDFFQLRSERALWPEVNAGQQVDFVEVPATVRMNEHNTKGILYTNELEVSFEVAGVTETRELEFGTLLGALDPHGAPSVRFDPKQPAHWALNWAVDAHRNRLEELLVTGVFGVTLVGGSFTFIGFALWAGADRVRRIALRGITVAAEVTEVIEQTSYGRKTGAVTHRFRMPASHGGKKREVVFHGKHPRPVLVLQRKYLVVCILASDPDVFVVPREDLFPFAFEEEVKRGILDRVAALRG